MLDDNKMLWGKIEQGRGIRNVEWGKISVVKKGLRRQRTKEVRNRHIGYIGKNVVSTENSKCEGLSGGSMSNHSGPLTCGFAFHSFHYPQSTMVWKFLMENSKNRQFICFRLCTVLISIMKSHTASLCLAPPPGHTPCLKSMSSHLSYQTDSWGITMLAFK